MQERLKEAEREFEKVENKAQTIKLEDEAAEIDTFNYKVNVKIEIPHEAYFVEEELDDDLELDLYGYCRSLTMILEQAFEKLDLPYSFGGEGDEKYLRMLNGYSENDLYEWKIYVEGQEQPYPMDDYCIETGWNIRLRYGEKD